jgi:hypothetical protein
MTLRQMSRSWTPSTFARISRQSRAGSGRRCGPESFPVENTRRWADETMPVQFSSNICSLSSKRHSPLTTHQASVRVSRIYMWEIGVEKRISLFARWVPADREFTTSRVCGIAQGHDENCDRAIRSICWYVMNVPCAMFHVKRETSVWIESMEFLRRSLTYRGSVVTLEDRLEKSGVRLD